MDEHQLRRLEVLEDRFHEHVEHYAQNNKTLALLLQRFEKHDEIEQEYQKRVNEQLDKIAKLDVTKACNVIETYNSFLSFKSIIIGFGAVIAAFGIIGSAIVGILHVIRN